MTPESTHRRHPPTLSAIYDGGPHIGLSDLFLSLFHHSTDGSAGQDLVHPRNSSCAPVAVDSLVGSSSTPEYTHASIFFFRPYTHVRPKLTDNKSEHVIRWTMSITLSQLSPSFLTPVSATRDTGYRFIETSPAISRQSLLASGNQCTLSISVLCTH